MTEHDPQSDNRRPHTRLTHVDARGARMVDVSDKAITRRSATAEAWVALNAASAAAIRERHGKKGDALAVAQLAGIQAVKHTATLIPLCHPLPIDGVEVRLEVEPGDRVRITATAHTTAKTGVEMEALHAASTAALTVIDMIKSVQRDACIEQVRLLEKRGGVHGDYTATTNDAHDASTETSHTIDAAWPAIVCRVLTVSDRVSQGIYEDRSGPAVAAWLQQVTPDAEVLCDTVPDDPAAIEARLRAWTDETDAVQLILTTGGTGAGPRDHTPEATAHVIERPHPGLCEHARRVTGEQQPLSCLSRSVAGVRRTSLIINLPGSPRGAVEWLDALRPVLPHLLTTMSAHSRDASA